MTASMTFDERIAAKLGSLSPAERLVAGFFRENREEVLVASALELAKIIGTSDATVVRTTRALGYSGLDELRRALAHELRSSLSPAARLVRTLEKVGDDLESARRFTLDTHQTSLDSLRQNLTPDLFRTVVERIVTARRVVAFGIGPSSAMTEYLMIQLGRFGIDSMNLHHTGLLLADGLHRMRPGDVLIVLAYGRVYREVEALLERAAELEVPVTLITDSLGPLLARRVETILTVARGRTEMLSMHMATLGLLEALLVGVATKRRVETVAHLGLLNALRNKVVEKPMDLLSPTPSRSTRSRTRRRKGRTEEA